MEGAAHPPSAPRADHPVRHQTHRAQKVLDLPLYNTHLPSVKAPSTHLQGRETSQVLFFQLFQRLPEKLQSFSRHCPVGSLAVIATLPEKNHGKSTYLFGIAFPV